MNMYKRSIPIHSYNAARDRRIKIMHDCIYLMGQGDLVWEQEGWWWIPASYDDSLLQCKIKTFFVLN